MIFTSSAGRWPSIEAAASCDVCGSERRAFASRLVFLLVDFGVERVVDLTVAAPKSDGCVIFSNEVFAFPREAREVKVTAAALINAHGLADFAAHRCEVLLRRHLRIERALAPSGRRVNAVALWSRGRHDLDAVSILHAPLRGDHDARVAGRMLPCLRPDMIASRARLASCFVIACAPRTRYFLSIASCLSDAGSLRHVAFLSTIHF